jgi:hypothetical protein
MTRLKGAASDRVAVLQRPPVHGHRDMQLRRDAGPDGLHNAGTKGRSARQVDDRALIECLRPVVDAGPSYGYRRATAIVNRSLVAAGERRVDAKRVYRVMKSQGWLLQRYTGKSARTHGGVVVTLKSDLRWCADSFQIRCWNGERVQVAFSHHCCDRGHREPIARDGRRPTRERETGLLSDEGPRWLDNVSPAAVLTPMACDTGLGGVLSGRVF